ncbi:MAG: hypothetical protein HZC55_07400 [Verrucomicrobia bacterium]|nr:hypothetical protein [Verrucomicrobiota bacterium]
MSLALFSRPSLPLVRVLCLVLAVSGLSLVPTAAQSISASDGFVPDVDGTVNVLVTQPDGRILVGGQFSMVGGSARANVARLNLDGSVDQSFNPNANGPVRALVLQRDGRIVIGGDFTEVRPGASGAAVTRNRLARLNADGTVDATFNPNLGGQLQPQVHALLLQADGRIVAGGTFTTVQPNGAPAATTRNYLARFNADGTLDTAFNPNPNGIVLALALHVDNKIVVAGGFTTVWPAGDATASGRNRLARFNPNGSLDSEFNPNANNGVTTLAVQRDGKILLGGFFTTLHPPNDSADSNRARLARLNVDGTLDSEFYPRADGSVTSVVVQPDGAILVGGSFTSVWGRGASSVSRSYVARFNPDGSLDNNFAPAVNGAVNAFAFQPDGKVIIGGLFTRATPPGAANAILLNHVARLNTDGSFDTTFELQAGGRPLVSVTQADGKVVIGGSFSSVAGVSRNYVARLNADGSLDTAYNPDCNDRVYAMAVQADGKVIIGGAFTTVGGERRERLARLNPSGTIDSEFNPHFDGQIGTLVLLSDGKILVGGTFGNVTPARATESQARTNFVRLNADGTLDSAFDPNPNSTVSAAVVQSDGKIIIGGLFSAVRPGATSNTSASFVTRNFLARLNSDGTLDTAFTPTLNGQVSTLALQSDGKVILGGAFTTIVGSDGKLIETKNENGTTSSAAPTRNRIARLDSSGNLDSAYDPNANGNVLASVLQSDGKLVIGGAFTTLQPNGASDWTLRKYAARLNTDGSVDATFNLDLSELPGNRVDSLRLQSDGRLVIGGAFTSLHPLGGASRVARANFARLLSNGQVDTAFDAAAGGATGAVVNALALQSDGRVIAVGSFSDLGGAKSVNIARFRAEGTPDPEFSPQLSTDGAVNAVIVRPVGAPTSTQLGGFAWLNANGTLRTSFAATTQLSGEISAIAVDGRGRLLLGGSFSNLSGATGGNLVRFNADGSLDTGFNPRPNGAVTGIIVQSDTRIVVVGSFTTVADTTRNRIARIDDNGSLDVTYDPNANARIAAIAVQDDGRMVVGGEFTSFTPNLASTAVTRNYLARVNVDGTIDANYNPSPNYFVNALTVQGDGKIVAGGSFTSVSPNGATTATTRNYLARFNTDGTLDQNFNPNANSTVNVIAALSNGQFYLGGSFTTLQANATGTIYTRNNLARINSDGALDQAFNPNPNGVVTSIARQSDGSVLIGGSFTTLQPNAAGSAIARNRFARIRSDGTLDLDFNPDIRGTVNVVAVQSDGTLLVGGNFTDLQLNGSILVGGSFASVGGVGARNLAMLNNNGSVTTSFQPRPDGAVFALLALPDGRAIVGGAFGNIAGVARSRLARFNADGSFDSAYNASAPGPVRALALQADGRVLVGGTGIIRLNANGTPDATFSSSVTGQVTALAVQADGRILVVSDGSGVRSVLSRINANGSADATFTAVNAGSAVIHTLSLQADGAILVGAAGTLASGGGGATRPFLALLRPNGAIDPAYAPAIDGAVSALALQPDGRLMVGGGFRRIGGVARPSIARLSAAAPAAQALGVAANRGSVVLNRTGALGEVSAVIFEQSADRATWTRLGEGIRAPGTANWQIAGLNLPASGIFYLRARSLAVTTAGTASGLYETVREFNYTSPVPGLGLPAAATSVPVQAAAQLPIDEATGIIPRSVLTTVPGEGTVEIIVNGALQASGARVARLTNLSTRGRVSTADPLVLGFALSGQETRRVLVRGVGPGLGGFGVAGAIATPRLQVADATGAVLAVNQGWNNAAEVAQVAARTGAFPLASGSADSAVVLNLTPGNYTLQIDDPRGAGGVALAEIYDAGTGSGAHLVNVSSRGAAGAGADALISGFVLEGGLSARVLLRGVGPGLAPFGATRTVADPVVALYDGTGSALGANDNWVSSVPDIASAAARSGAFPLTAGSKDAAVLATLPAGVYTLQVSGGTANAATALLEIYEVP